MNFVVLCSSRGTVFQSVLERVRDGSLNARCLGLVADRADRGCVGKAQQHGVPVAVVERKKGEEREEYDKRLDQAINSFGGRVDLVACIGWMRILSPWFVQQWKNKILNVHPSLLPKHPGAHAHDLVLASKDTVSGMTIHLIDEGMDTGQILLQKECPVMADDTVETLKTRVQSLEAEWYPNVLDMIERGEIQLPA
jgi:phosphoribosylglycinamide formyltransferase 1